MRWLLSSPHGGNRPHHRSSNILLDKKRKDSKDILASVRSSWCICTIYATWCKMSHLWACPMDCSSTRYEKTISILGSSRILVANFLSPQFFVSQDLTEKLNDKKIFSLRWCSSRSLSRLGVSLLEFSAQGCREYPSSESLGLGIDKLSVDDQCRASVAGWHSGHAHERDR